MDFRRDDESRRTVGATHKGEQYCGERRHATCYMDVATPKAGRRVRVTSLTRRCRANTRTCERAGKTENIRIV
jgi:hypothetical protein